MNNDDPKTKIEKIDIVNLDKTETPESGDLIDDSWLTSIENERQYLVADGAPPASGSGKGGGDGGGSGGSGCGSDGGGGCGSGASM